MSRWTYLTDTLKILASFIALYIAWRGLETWKKQLKGTEKYKIAGDLLLAVYRLREEIKVVRSSFISYAPDQSAQTKEQADYRGYVKEMDRRWRGLSEPAVDIDLLKLKAEVYLDKSVVTNINKLMKKVHELRTLSDMYVEFKDPASQFDFYKEFKKEGAAILWSRPNEDKFNSEVEEIIKKIELQLREFI